MKIKCLTTRFGKVRGDFNYIAPMARSEADLMTSAIISPKIIVNFSVFIALILFVSVLVY